MEHSCIEGDGVSKTITDKRLNELLAKITPLIEKKESLWEFRPTDPRSVAYTWSPILTKPALSFESLKEIAVDFPCGYYGFFKPSLAEVLAWFPDDVENVNAFYIKADQIEIYETGLYQRAVVVFGKVQK